MVINRATGETSHRRFANVLEYLDSGDCLVVNDTRVMAARLFGTRATGGKVEILMIKELEGELWEVLAKPAKKLRLGDRLLFAGDTEHPCPATVADVGEAGIRTLEFEGDPRLLMQSVGAVPLPPYIEKSGVSGSDPIVAHRYQTVFADRTASIAAPTAGLHFTEDLLGAAREKGVEVARVTLEVGWDTFKPVRAELVADHRVHHESYCVSSSEAAKMNAARSAGRRIVAVGTTTVRVLETVAANNGAITPGSGVTDIFIHPGYEFKAVDSMITNFHLPRSSLLMLVAAFAGLDRVMSAYQTAIANQYRFYSFGDAMLIK